MQLFSYDKLGCIEPATSMMSLRTSFDISLLNNIPEKHNYNIQSKIPRIMAKLKPTHITSNNLNKYNIQHFNSRMS